MIPRRQRAQLRRFLAGRVCVLGVGNRDRRDDGVGSLLVDALRARTSAVLIDAGEVPENYLERSVRARPDAVLLVDAVDLGATPGTVQFVSPRTLHDAGVSTHASSLALCAEYIGARTGAPVALLGIQPADVGPGAGLSGDVAAAMIAVRDTLQNLLPGRGARRCAD